MVWKYGLKSVELSAIKFMLSSHLNIRAPSSIVLNLKGCVNNMLNERHVWI
jgi:hypothetical protein